MTLEDIRKLLTQADIGIRHYFSMEKEKDYTYWEETRRLPFTSDDGHDEGWRFYVHRYTRQENDRVAADLFRILDAHPGIAVTETIDHDPDTGYIHHIFECEGY